MYSPCSWEIAHLIGSAVETRGRQVDTELVQDSAHRFACVNLGQRPVPDWTPRCYGPPASYDVLAEILDHGPPHYGGVDMWSSHLLGDHVALRSLAPTNVVPALYWPGQSAAQALEARFGTAASSFVEDLVLAFWARYKTEFGTPRVPSPEAVHELRATIHREWAGTYAAYKEAYHIDGPNAPESVLVRRQEMNVQ
jgi:hypothetical protein